MKMLDGLKKRRASSDSLLVLIVLVAVGYFLYTSGALDGFLNQGGSAGMELTITYTDGTTRVVRQDEPSWLDWIFKANSITDSSHKEIQGISYQIRVNPVYTGTVSGTLTEGTISFTVTDGVAQSTPKTESIYYTSKINSGVITTVKSGTLYAQTLESWAPSMGPKTLRIKADISFTVQISAEETSTKTASSFVDFWYEVTSGITGLSVQVTASGLY